MRKETGIPPETSLFFFVFLLKKNHELQ